MEIDKELLGHLPTAMFTRDVSNPGDMREQRVHVLRRQQENGTVQVWAFTTDDCSMWSRDSAGADTIEPGIRGWHISREDDQFTDWDGPKDAVWL